MSVDSDLVESADHRAQTFTSTVRLKKVVCFFRSTVSHKSLKGLKMMLSVF